MFACQRTPADSPPLKRSFLDIQDTETATYNAYDYRISQGSSEGYHRQQSLPSPTKRRSISISRTSSMPIPTGGSTVTAAFPTFMSVFGGDKAGIQDAMVEDASQKEIGDVRFTPVLATNPETSLLHFPRPIPLQHRDSCTSLSSISTESSPTTTVSTLDSPSITEPSPSSSPESPSSTLPLSPFKAMMRSSTHAKMNNDSEIPLQHQQRAESPNSRLRNVKNLSLNMASPLIARPATSSGIESSFGLSLPMSPLREPLRTGRRKPANLTIQTPGPENLTFLRPSSEIPSTPSTRPLLHHSQTSPALTTFRTPLTGPAKGMQLPPIRQPHSRAGSQSNPLAQLETGNGLPNLREEEDDHSHPQRSQETQERGYTNGPVKVYDSGVYLYLEPSSDEARRFDTVINVAKEIKSPFEPSDAKSPDTVMSVWRADSDRSAVPEPQTAISEKSFKSAFEWPRAADSASPTTPKAGASHKPEYIHVPWDHNSEIVDDLYPLCKIIDERVANGKTVLVHCQLGVSRSASLVIAYGLFKGYKPDFHSMYGSVKERSQWVGPNMSLIYQLMDFRSKLDKAEYAHSAKSASPDWFKSVPAGDSTTTPTATAQPILATVSALPLAAASAAATTVTQSIPMTLNRLMKKLPPVPLFSSNPSSTMEGTLPDVQPDIASSAGSAQTVFPATSSSPPATSATISSVAAMTRPLPLREQAYRSKDLPPIPPHRGRPHHLPGLGLRQPSAQMDLAMQDVPKTPSLFSPRAAEFLASPFGVTVAGDLATKQVTPTLTPSLFGFKPASEERQASPVEVDPRSPHQRSDHAEILRHIDDFL